MAKTIGHTSSGKPVYAAFQFHPNFAGWTAVDHWDAADLHEAAKRVDIKTNVSMHENSAALHSEEAQQLVKAVEKMGLGRGAKSPSRRHSTSKSGAQLDREIAQSLGRSHSEIKRKPPSWKQMGADYKRRARAAEREGGKVKRYPDGSILILPVEGADEYFYQDWQADELFERTERENKELLKHVSIEDLLLAQSQGW